MLKEADRLTSEGNISSGPTERDRNVERSNLPCPLGRTGNDHASKGNVSPNQVEVKGIETQPRELQKKMMVSM